MISGHTRVAGVIGDPVRHSLSPALHNAAYEAIGLDWVYMAFPVKPPDLGAALDAVAAMDLGGLSVTMPHKAEAARRCDRLSPTAQRLGMVNAVRPVDGALVGENVDGDGLVAALRIEHGIDLERSSVAVLGAGGAARAIIEALGRVGARSIGVINRTEANAASAATLAPTAKVLAAESIGTVDVIVNATPVGMDGGGASDGWLIDPNRLEAGQMVFDTVYHPAVTPLMAAADERGCTTANGVAMLLHLSGLVFSRFTGEPAPMDAMRAVLG